MTARSGHLWLIGMMGSGKTAVGRKVADSVATPFTDTDEAIAGRLDASIEAIWSERGEAAFRELESAEVSALASGDVAVIATGGGVVTREENVAAMRSSGFVVWLVAPVRDLLERVGSGEGRPLLANEETEALLEGIAEERAARYEAAAHVSVATAGREIDDVAEEVIELWTAS